MKRMYPSGRPGQLVLIVIGAVLLGLTTGLGYVALTSRATDDRLTALPDKGNVSPDPSPSVSATPSMTPTPTTVTPPVLPTAAPTVSAPATASAPASAPASAAVPAPTTSTRAAVPKKSASAAAPSQASRAVYSVDSRLFGVHDPDSIGDGWPKAPVRSLRVWDAGAMWREIEREPGKFDFTHLDAMVSTARANGADALVVLGQTPEFHAVNPRAASFYGAGASSMPKMAAWKRYVAKIGKRYRGQPVRFQVWNEANVIGFWSGTHHQMAQLTKAAYDVLQQVNPGATLVAPALVTRLSSQRTWINKFYGQRVAGRPVAAWVDVVSLQLYPAATGTPEDSMDLLQIMRGTLARHGVRKPIWNTEVNYGMTGKPVRALSGSRQAAYVARTYLLNAANGIRRVYWYGWQTQTIVSTRMVTSDLATPTRAGVAFGTVSEWMRGTQIDSCPRSRNGTYTCTLTKGGETRRIYWNPSRTVTLRIGAGATTLRKLNGSSSDVTGGSSISVGYEPVMVS